MPETIKVYAKKGQLVIEQGTNKIEVSAAQALALAEQIIRKAQGK